MTRAVANILLIRDFGGSELGGDRLACHQFATECEVHEVNLARGRGVVGVDERRLEVPVAIHSWSVRIGTPAAAIRVPNVWRLCGIPHKRHLVDGGVMRPV